VNSVDPGYAERWGRLLARLHSIDTERADAAGVEVRTSDRGTRPSGKDIARVCEAFTVLPALSHAWQVWHDDDTCWPDHTLMTHGEIYPARRGQCRHGCAGSDDSTCGQPPQDRSGQYGVAGEEMLQVTLAAYTAERGRVHDGLTVWTKYLWDAASIGYALYARITGKESGLATAAATRGLQD
jgi:macrolide phosphotransferase